MSEEIPEHTGDTKLAVAISKKMRSCGFNPSIIGTVEALGELGMSIRPGTAPNYVLSYLLECAEGLRTMRKSNESLASSERRRLSKLKAEALKEEDSDVLAKIHADIEQASLNITRHEIQQRSAVKSLETVGAQIVDLHKQLKAPEVRSGGSRSWDPDKPTVAVQVNVTGDATVTTGEE